MKVYQIWNDFFRNDTEIIGLIEKTEKYLLGQTSKKDLLNDADHLDMFADDYIEDDMTASFAAKVAVHAAYDAGSDANSIISDYDSDEEVEDPDEWDTAFLASLVYNGGIVDLDFLMTSVIKSFGAGILPIVSKLLVQMTGCHIPLQQAKNTVCQIHSLSYTTKSLER